ncbi:winged helix-turn-helix domain-containing protein [Streptomyces sp. NPDC087422]|uniref:winged helix-turn-helix domain-containing protein n=1 Tax=Streptomyces sp. NPDC087422 TaxID=3365786 RepID=UPI003828102A
MALKGSPGRPRLSDAQIARLEQELQRGPLVHGWADQRWTPTRVKTLIGPLCHVSYTVEGTWWLLRRHSWSWRSQPGGCSSGTMRRTSETPTLASLRVS